MLVDCPELLLGYKIRIADPGDLVALGLGLRPFACWVCGFGSHRSMDISRFWMLYLSNRDLCYGPIPNSEEPYY